jgi:hypothetical protein
MTRLSSRVVAVDLRHVRLLRTLLGDSGQCHPTAAEERPVPEGAERKGDDSRHGDGEPMKVCNRL